MLSMTVSVQVLKLQKMVRLLTWTGSIWPELGADYAGLMWGESGWSPKDPSVRMTEYLCLWRLLWSKAKALPQSAFSRRPSLQVVLTLRTGMRAILELKPPD